MKSFNQLDLEEEWELLPNEGFLEIHDDGGKKIYSRKYPSEFRSVFHMNYFNNNDNNDNHNSPSPPNNMPNNKQILPLVPFDLKPAGTSSFNTQQDPNEVQKTAILIPVREIKIMTPPPQQVSETIIKSVDTSSDDHNNKESFSQVFFNKLMKETDHQFVDMKVESPKINNSNRGIMQQPSQIEGAFDQLEEKIKTCCEEDKVMGNPNKNKNNDDEVELNGDDDDDDDEGGMNIWKRSLTGIGAICSFGVAAATICIVIFGSHNKKQNQKLPFQIYNNDRRIKHVFRHASKLNEAITGLRGSVPITRAHITVGGYYEAAI